MSTAAVVAAGAAGSGVAGGVEAVGEFAATGVDGADDGLEVVSFEVDDDCPHPVSKQAVRIIAPTPKSMGFIMTGMIILRSGHTKIICAVSLR